MRHVYGLRTFIAALVAIVALVVGLYLLKDDQRATAFVFFSGGIVGALGVLGAKSAISGLAEGTGTKGAWAALTTDKKPGEPPVTP